MRDHNTPAPPCPTCGSPRVTYRDKSDRRAGLPNFRCLPCRAARLRRHYADDPEPIKERNRLGYQANIEERRDYARRWAAEHPEQRSANSQRRRERDPDGMAERLRAWKEANPERARETREDWLTARADRFRQSKRAKNRVQRAIRQGKLIRSDTCEECGQKGVAIEAAHSDYNRPLEVRWLCRPCHRRWDRQEPKTLLSSADRSATTVEAPSAS